MIDKPCKPGKRLRSWHRNCGTTLSLREFARAWVWGGKGEAATDVDKHRAAVALRWLRSKGARP